MPLFDLLPAAPILGWAVHAWQLHRLLGRTRRDPLTGLLTRDGWSRRAARIVRRRPESAVLLLDLNGFKPVNDRFGHAAGDAVLAATGQRLADWCAHHGGLAGRLGGDEFVAVLRDGQDLEVRLVDLAGRIAAPVAHGGLLLRVSASIGSARRAQLPQPTLSALTAAADADMYRVKGSGRRGRPPARQHQLPDPPVLALPAPRLV